MIKKVKEYETSLNKKIKLEKKLMMLKNDKNELLEKCAEAIHKAYCAYHLKNKGEEYWTKGNYLLLDEPAKQIDRETVKAVFKVLKDNGMGVKI